MAVLTEEQRRLQILDNYNILDTPANRALDTITQLATRLFQMPISLVSLVDAKRQWFKSRCGLDSTETPREHAFCAHAIEREGVFLVHDARADDRFADNPLVTDAPHIRFYAGAPLRVREGCSLGTLCIIDTQPRSLSKDDLESLESLRDVVVEHLQQHQRYTQLKATLAIDVLCAWCGSVKCVEDNRASWRPLKDHLACLPDVSHGVCPACSEQLLRHSGLG